MISVDAALGWTLAGAGWGLGAVALGVASAGAVLTARRTNDAAIAQGQQ